MEGIYLVIKKDGNKLKETEEVIFEEDEDMIEFEPEIWCHKYDYNKYKIFELMIPNYFYRKIDIKEWNEMGFNEDDINTLKVYREMDDKLGICSEYSNISDFDIIKGYKITKKEFKDE